MNSSDRRFPTVTLLLIAANLMAAFALLVDPDLAFTLGFQVGSPRIVTAFTSLFLHANVIHLLGNLVFLAAVGASVELATGSIRFIAVYLASGLGGVLTHYLVMRSHLDVAPFLGASGCIAGCVGYYSVRYTSLRVPVAPHRAASVAVITAVWVILQVVGGFVRLGDTAGTAFWAHLGGFATGVLASLAFRAPDLGQRKLGHEVLDHMNVRGPAAMIAVTRRHLKRHPGDVHALQELARAYAQIDDAPGEAGAILELIGLQPEAELPSLLGRLLEIGQASQVASVRRLVWAEKLKDESPAVARGLLKSVIAGPADDSQRPEAMLALAGMERPNSPDVAQALLTDLEAAYPLHPCVDLARKRGWVI